MEGFRTCLERAIRIQDEIDWSVHTVDYVLFKRRLRVFANRRSRLRELIRASPDERIPQNVVTAILGPIAYQSPALAFLGMKAENEREDMLLRKNPSSGLHRDRSSRSADLSARVNTNSGGAPPNTGDYVPFVESAVSSTSMSGSQLHRAVSSHPVLHQIKQQTAGADQVTAEQIMPSQSAAAADPDDLLQADLSVSNSRSDSSQCQMPYNPTQNSKRLKKRSIWRGVSNAERNELVLFLTWEMDKVAMFYLARWQRLSQLIVSEGPSTELGDEILELIAFCTINVVTVRQILIRYDAFARTFEGTPLLHYYMKRVNRRQTSFRKVLFHEELNALADSFMQDMRSDPSVWTVFEGQRKLFQDILDSTQRSEAIASTGHELFTDSFVHTLRHYFLLGGIEDALGLQPEFLTLRGQSLTHEMAKLADWRKSKYLEAEPPEEKQIDKLSGKEIFHLTLTLISTFLYCMNYYIVEPSSTMYCNALGAYDAMSGSLIGMTPLAALFSAVPYSIWTNKCFRQPVLVSSCLLIAGNLLYATAYNFQSIEVALLGRFLTGLGAPKVIVRRYMADTTPVSLRTGVNAGFGMVVAVGSALGPATAIYLSNAHYRCKIPFVGMMIVNGLTAPGYFMAVLWICFTIITVVTFGEPNRQGLKEQKKMEQEGRINNSVNLETPGTPPEYEDDEYDEANRQMEATEYELQTIFSGEESQAKFEDEPELLEDYDDVPRKKTWRQEAKEFFDLITLPVRICLGLLLAKVFSIEILVSATSALSKNRYHWQVHQVGTLGCINGLLVIPISVLVGRLSMSYQDRTLMTWLVAIGCAGMFLLIDLTDIVATPTHTYNRGHILSVMPQRYVLGYFLVYSSIQCFEGIIGSTLSKVIPTALASGTLNSGLLATLVDTFGRACGDMFISVVGFINLRQLMDLLFIPGFGILMACLVVIRKFYDILAV